MSAKWRALQHRHRYTYSVVVFPQDYIDSLNLLPSDISLLKFFTELKELISLTSTYSQVEQVKKVTLAFEELLSNGGDVVVSEAARFYLEILFLENSLPLHRTLVSVLAKVRDRQSVIGSCLHSLFDAYGVLGSKRKRFSVSRVALSLMSCPKLGFLVDILEECSISVALDVAFGMNVVVSEIEGGSRPSPIVLEQCQEALSCLYYLFLRFASRFTDAWSCRSSLIPENSTIFEVIMKSILRILKSAAFSRDCWVAAGVSFCAALQVWMNPKELAFFLVKFFYYQTSCLISGYENESRSSNSSLPYKGDVHLEIEDLSVLSRLCLLRGVLTAIPRTVLNTHFIFYRDSPKDLDFRGSRNDSIWTIIFDGILPELCKYCENPIDSHFNFHVLTVMQICFQQIKTSILAGLVNWAENYDPLPEKMGTRILRIIWNNLENPLSQTVKQVHLIFDLILDTQSRLHLAEGGEGKFFLRKTAADLLRLGARCRGRYVPLASLTKRLGAKTILDMSPNLLFETVHAYVDDDVCCAATSFLKCFLECLRDECWSIYGVESGYVTFRGHCLPAVLYGLVSGVSKLRSNLNTYALPVLLEVDVDSIFAMLAYISVGCGYETEMDYPELPGTDKDLLVDQQVGALVSLLKVSRSLALIEGDIDWYHNASIPKGEDGLEPEGHDLFAFVCIKGIKVKIIVEWLQQALTHVDETLRIDAAEFLFSNPKTSSLPSTLELSLMKEAVPLNMRCSSTGFQMKWTSLFRKFFARVRTALERQFKQGRWLPLASSDNYKVDPDRGMKENMADRAQNLFHFMKWLSCFLFFSCYPSAPYERKIMAMELLLIMTNIWPILPHSQGKCNSISPATCLNPYNKGFTLPDSTLLLVGSIIDSWDRLRECSFRVLLHFPTPLPGIFSQETVKEVITWSKRLVCSLRVRECDAGALTLRLIFRKYVLGLGWPVGALVNVVPHDSECKLTNEVSKICKLKLPVIDYIVSLIDWLHIAVVEGEKDLTEACKNSFVHGILLTLRYTFEELDWNSSIVLSSSSEMKLAMEKLLELIMRITSLALWVVSADAWYLPEELDDVAADEAFRSNAPVEMDMAMSSPELQVNNSKLVDSVKPSEQVVMVGCWLAVKEVSLLLGTIIRKIPLPSCTSMVSTKHGEPFCETTDLPLVMTSESDAMLDITQLEKIGNHFLEVLLKMKHNGAIDKTRAGFTALCNRLLCSNDPWLCKMTESWMEQLMERTVANGQTVDDLVRRSAGIPAAFIALFLSEPKGTPKKLLPRALKWLIDVASVSLSNSTKASSQQAHHNDFHVDFEKLGQAYVCAPPLLVDMSERNLKIQDQGVIPTVHAFNVLRASFNDTNLATDTSGFCAAALIVSIRSFSSPYWEVRNSACLAYTALVRRMIGFLNVQKRESARRALTGLEFFHRYPVLHSFLFDELHVATELLGNGSSEHSKSNIAKVVHPSLCPILILLSRLKPSPISSENEDGLDPFLFMPFIRRCSTQSNLRVRVLASRALTGLVSNEKLPNVLLNIANELPRSISPSSVVRCNGINSASFNSIHGMLLQLSSLLDNNCRNLSDVSKKDRLLGELIHMLVTCSWIGNPRLCHCPILNCSFLQVLDRMLSIVMTCRSEHYGLIRTLLLESSLQCLDAEVSHGITFYDPTKMELRRQAAVSHFNCIFQASTDAGEDIHVKPRRSCSPALDLSKAPEFENAVTMLQERLMLSLSDASYEVRLGMLKCLLNFLKAMGPGLPNGVSESDIYIVDQWSKTYLQPSLMRMLAVEENPKCTYYILRIILSWNLVQFQKSDDQCMRTIYVGRMDYDTLFEFWNKLLSLNKVVRHLKTRETLLCCMGICVKRFACLFKSSFLLHLGGKKTTDSSLLDQPEKWAQILGCIKSFINLVKRHSASSESINMRKAAAESMVASGLLAEAEYASSFVSNIEIPSEEKCSDVDPSQAVETYSHGILDLWFTCIRLLEDEDIMLRQRLATDIQRCFTSKSSKRSQQNGLVPTQVEKAIEECFDFLSSLFGHWLVYLNYLLHWVLDTASCTLIRGDLVRRVFDKDIDNQHEEKLFICQICCFHLEKLPMSDTWAVNMTNRNEVVIFLQKWRMRFYHQLISFSSDYIGIQDGVDWIGGMGNHKDTFLSLYANLLGLYALSQCLFNGEAEVGVPLLTDLVELGGTIGPFLRNPLVSNLYSLCFSYMRDGLALWTLSVLNPEETPPSGKVLVLIFFWGKLYFLTRETLPFQADLKNPKCL